MFYGPNTQLLTHDGQTPMVVESGDETFDEGSKQRPKDAQRKTHNNPVQRADDTTS